MRNLTSKQKKMLKEWFVKNYDGGCMFDMADKIDAELYNKIDDINPCEVFHQNVNHYLEELVNNK
jgi:hypothetical protein